MRNLLNKKLGHFEAYITHKYTSTSETSVLTVLHVSTVRLFPRSCILVKSTGVTSVHATVWCDSVYL